MINSDWSSRVVQQAVTDVCVCVCVLCVRARARVCACVCMYAFEPVCSHAHRHARVWGACASLHVNGPSGYRHDIPTHSAAVCGDVSPISAITDRHVCSAGTDMLVLWMTASAESFPTARSTCPKGCLRACLHARVHVSPVCSWPFA